MPSMFSEADLDAFHRLRCAFDPPGLANPGKLMPTPRLCGEVPGPYREHPLERAGVADAVLMAAAAFTDQRFEEAAAALAAPPRPTARPFRIRAAARSSDGARHARPTGRAAHTRARQDPRAQRRRSDGGRSRPALRSRSAQEALAAQGQMLALDPPLGIDARRRDDRRRVRDRRLRPAAPPLRRPARSGARRHRRAQRRHDRPRRRQGDQERRRLRPRQAVHGLVRDARVDPVGVRAAAPAPRDTATALGASGDPRRCRRRPRRSRRRRSSSRRSTSPGAAAAAVSLPAPPASRPFAAPAASPR